MSRGQYIPETLMNAVQEVEEAYEHYKNDPEFVRELDDLYRNYAGRPSMLCYAEKMTRDLGGATATATAAALMGLTCEVFMGKEDTDRQALNVFRMELLGAKVHAVTSGTMTLKDAVNEAMRISR